MKPGCIKDMRAAAVSAITRRTVTRFCVLPILFSFAAPARAADERESDFRRFLAWWPGNYDNDAQVKAQAASAAPAEGRNQAFQLHIKRVDLPAFGKDVYYIEWRTPDAPSVAARQRIYALSLDKASGKPRLELHIWPENRPDFAARTAGAYTDSSRLAGVTPADMSGLMGCDLLFTRNGAGFDGAMTKGACAFTLPGGTPVYSWSQMNLTVNHFRYIDGWFNPDGSVFRKFPGGWYEFVKING